MISSNLLIAVALAYVAFLFAIAALADRQVRRGQFRWLQSPLVYTLSLSVYCTAWTFYGAVGSAVRNGLEFLAIYLGPTILFVGWFWILRKLVRIGRTQRITSIADLISSRYGKSTPIAAVVTILAVIASTPYIALQLQSLTISFEVLTAGPHNPSTIGFWIAAGLAIFTILFGTRNVDANERHHGVVTAIAFEAIVKLVAVLAVGIFVVFGLAGGPAEIFANAPEQMLDPSATSGARWIALCGLSAMAIITLPRMFQVLVVENVDERHLATAAWAFPAYLMLISLFVVPIAIAGLTTLPATANPDMFVLTVPLNAGQETLALLAFLGGFSAATSMVIVSSIAVSTMVSNHLVMPVWLKFNADQTITSGDVRGVLLSARRASIGGILLLGYLYFQVSGGSEALAAMGLIAFAGMAQLIPALIGGIFWRGATRQGAMTGLLIGAVIWAFTHLLPSLEDKVLTETIRQTGLFGLPWLRPQALFGLTGFDPLVHALFWSLTFNTLCFITVSLLTTPTPLDRLQTTLFVDVFRHRADDGTVALSRSATSEDLFTLAQRILGADTAYHLFQAEAARQNQASGLPNPTERFIQTVERELSGSVGSASAHAMVSQIAGGGTVSVDDLIDIADETAQILQYSQKLENQSAKLEETARKLRAANMQLTELGAQKDAFLSQVSHELRTPMTSIRSLSDLLREGNEIPPEDAQKFISVIGQESERLTRLLDEILDLSFLESGRAMMRSDTIRLGDVIDRAVQSTITTDESRMPRIIRDPSDEDIEVSGDFDRLSQVLINLFTNAVKYGHAKTPQIRLSITKGSAITLDVSDNGPGIAPEHRAKVFEKFTRLSSENLAGSAGLGLAISLEIMRNLGGNLELIPSTEGATFRVTLLPATSGHTAEGRAAAE